MRVRKILSVLVLATFAACAETSTEPRSADAIRGASSTSVVDSTQVGNSGASRGGNTMGSGN